MRKKNKEQVELSKEVFEDFFWMSYRYCIGRHTIATHYHALNIARLMSIFSEERQVFNAHDILREVNDVVRISNNWIFSVYEDSDCSLINVCLKYLAENHLFEQMQYIERICVNKKISNNEYEVTHTIGTVKDRYSIMLDDLMVWNDVANIFIPSNHKIAVIEYDGKVTEEEVYESWNRAYDNSYEYPIYIRHWKSVENGKKGNLESWIADEYIKEIKNKE